MEVNLQQIVLLQLFLFFFLKKKLHTHIKQLETCTATIQDVAIAFQYENIVLIKHVISQRLKTFQLYSRIKRVGQMFTCLTKCVYNRQKKAHMLISF